MNEATMEPLLEICVDSHAGLTAAIEGGADRIELCAALDLGGLSPSLALMKAARDCPIPVYCMIRPRPGDFLFSSGEIAGMCSEIEQVRQIGLAGVVLGAGSPDRLDIATLKTLAAAAVGMGRTLHRVVDLLKDRKLVPALVHSLGFERILTSGGVPNVADGLNDIAAMTAAAPTDISIMPGGGVTPENAASILHRTGAREIHASARSKTTIHPPELQQLGFVGDPDRTTDIATVRALKRAIRDVR